MTSQHLITMLQNFKYLCFCIIIAVLSNNICAQNNVIGLNDLISYAYKLSANIELYKIQQKIYGSISLCSGWTICVNAKTSGKDNIKTKKECELQHCNMRMDK